MENASTNGPQPGQNGSLAGQFGSAARAADELDAESAGPVADGLSGKMKLRVIAQDQAIDTVANFYQMSEIGLNTPGRPIGSFLFLGPTGVGKTKTVEALAECTLGDPRAVIKIDCAEFQHSHDIAKLIGSPPGYLGHRETHPLLSQEVLNQHHTDKIKRTFVLFDEIEKASDALWNLMLGILDKATLTLGDNRRVDFSRAMIFMTSNLGAQEMQDLLKKKIGFYEEQQTSEQLSKKMEDKALNAVRRKFTPEFVNRIDKLVVFKPLGKEDLRKILDLELDHVQGRLAMSPAAARLKVTDAAKEQILKEAAPDIKSGARHVPRAVQQQVTQKLANLIAKGSVKTGDEVTVDYRGDHFAFTKSEGAAFGAYNRPGTSSPPPGTRR